MSLPNAFAFQSAQSALLSGVGNALQWASPWYWIVLAIPLFMVSVLHPVPWRLPSNDASFHDWIAFIGRRASVFLLYVWLLLVPLIAFVVYIAASGLPLATAATSFGAELRAQFGQYWPVILTAALYGAALRFLWDRYAAPRLSAWWRSMRVTQKTDRLVDAREEVATLKAKAFQPEKYFAEGRIFYGLDEHNQPIYFDLKEYFTTHHAILGPTAYGKGILLQSVFKQCIRFGFGIFYIDPKGDDWLPYLLQNEAKETGRRFVYLDLNPGGKGVWHPFLGGDFRQRRTRIVRAFNLESHGTDADVYKAKERALLDDALENTDGTIKALLAYVKDHGNAGDRDLSTLRDSLREWSRVETFAQPARRKGHSIEACLMNNAVVYVRGDLADPVVKAATKAYISELTAEIKRLLPKRPAHVSVGIDELKFLACAEINDALATIRQNRCNLLLAAQSIANLEAPDDKRLDGKALAREFEVNTPIKFVYRAADERTAEWAEKLSAGRWLNVVQRESTKINLHGGEQWDGHRMIGKQEQPVISQSTLLSLPARIAIAYMPGRIAGKLYTSPTQIDRSFASWEAGPTGAEQAVEATPTP
ncbi:conjugal transfer protein TraC [Paraburkholderia phymatum]|uniref:conjugal transfer protein TraC n=1 Tax=Paraburkholderia phymatum TaxID=148447 RepID=UPI00317910E4